MAKRKVPVKKPVIKESTITIRPVGNEVKIIEDLKAYTNQKTASKAILKAAEEYKNKIDTIIELRSKLKIAERINYDFKYALEMQRDAQRRIDELLKKDPSKPSDNDNDDDDDYDNYWPAEE